ncbi:MAG: hypothetical protein KGL39_08325 [Patescibacteria group bacterium]|nr:hypothetical protein [Patescibacteria group bacterium]
MKNKILLFTLIALPLLAAPAFAQRNFGSGPAGVGNRVMGPMIPASSGTTTSVPSFPGEKEKIYNGGPAGMRNLAPTGTPIRAGATTSRLNVTGTPAGAGPNSIALQRRSAVANAVQQMLQVADRTGGIGQQIRVIAQNQEQNQIKAEDNLTQVQSRNAVVKFLIGPNYGAINNAQKLIQQNQQQIQQLTQLKSQVTNQSDQQQLTQQIGVLEQANQQLGASLQQASQGFSLLGWLFGLINR